MDQCMHHNMELTMINLAFHGKHFKPKCAIPTKIQALGVRMNVRILDKVCQQVQSDSAIVQLLGHLISFCSQPKKYKDYFGGGVWLLGRPLMGILLKDLFHFCFLGQPLLPKVSQMGSTNIYMKKVFTKFSLKLHIVWHFLINL